MTRQRIHVLNASMLLAISLALAGCLEVSQDAAFRENGEARVEVEIAISAELVALASNPAFAKQPGAEGLNFFSECGKPWPADKPLLEGVRSAESRRGKRGDMETCTIVFDVADPIVAVDSAKKIEPPSAEMPKQVTSLTRLPSNSGYRLYMDIPGRPQPDVPAEAAQMLVAMTKAMLANRFLAISLSGAKIENTNGVLAPDGRRVSWQIPIATAIDPSRQSPLTIEADILYK